MTLRRWLFDVEPSGTELSTSNVLSEDGAAASLVLVSIGTGEVVSAPGHTGLAAQFTVDASSAAIARLPMVNASRAGAVSFYSYAAEAPQSPAAICVVNNAAGGRLLRVALNADGSMSIQDATYANVATTAAGAWVAGRWNRVELRYFIDPDGFAEVTVHDADDLTEDASAMYEGDTGSVEAANFDMGNTNPIPEWVHLIDDVQMNDGAARFIGPYIDPSDAFEVPLNPPTNSGGWPPRTGAVDSPHADTEIAWSADRGWLSSQYTGSPDLPPPDAAGVVVTLPEEKTP